MNLVPTPVLNEVEKWPYLWLREPKRSAPEAIDIRSLSTMEMANIPLIACLKKIRLSADSEIHRQVIHAGHLSLLPFLTSNSRNFFSRFELSSLENVGSTLFAACNFFFHSDGDNGVALMDGSSKGRCDTPPSNCPKKKSWTLEGKNWQAKSWSLNARKLYRKKEYSCIKFEENWKGKKGTVPMFRHYRMKRFTNNISQAIGYTSKKEIPHW